MNTFSNAVNNQKVRTTNGMVARKSSSNYCLDLFYSIGASRGKDIIPAFVSAFAENKDVALRIAAWARDIRGGSGERQIFRDILSYLSKADIEIAKALMVKIPELGRWDDLLVVKEPSCKKFAFDMIASALKNADGLCAKWMPRKGPIANELRSFMKLTPKQYRKVLVALTRVVENKMCKNQWDSINFSQVPSVASARYKKAFNRHTPKYAKYVESLMSGDKSAKVNASAIFPHDVLRGRIGKYNNFLSTELNFIQAQWDALPNYVGDACILPLVDVSGSMTCRVAGNIDLTCMEVAVSLGLYLADKNKGKFKDLFLTFSSTPSLVRLKGNINQKIDQMVSSNWSMSTNLNAAFNLLLKTAVDGKVPQSEMPKTLIIFSDMQFDRCIQFDHSAFEMIKHKFEKAGYSLPGVVFWNLNDYGNVPVKVGTAGTALVSGFSPALLKAILEGNTNRFTPESVMFDAVMIDRYRVI